MNTDKATALPLTALDALPTPNREAIQGALAEALEKLNRKIVVLDDDPTGIQTVHGVAVYTAWDAQTLREAFAEPAPLFFVLTNSRALTARQTEALHREIALNVVIAARETGKDYLVISRGDSTLRGHYPLETETLRDTLEAAGGKRFAGEVILPYFLQGGRYTLNDVHYVREGDRLTPVGQTEFAQDRTFGFRASHLGAWCEEKTGGRYRAAEMVYLSLADLRAVDLTRLTNQLTGARDFQKIIVNAACDADVEVFVLALCAAMREGREYLFRSAAALPKTLGGIADKPLLTAAELLTGAGDNGGMVLVGSHVGKTTRQLDALLHSGLPLDIIEFNQHLVLKPGGLAAETARAAAAADAAMLRGRTAVVYTRRERLDLPGADPEGQLRISVEISAAVTDVVARLTVRPRFIIAKGGITSSDVGVKALGVRRATVLGQIAPGVPVWQTGPESKFPMIPYVIFPGNVGEDATLRTVVERFWEAGC